MRGDPNKFLTLTVNPAIGDSPAHRAQLLAHAWKTLLKRLRRKYPGEQFAYHPVFEETKAGEPHLHILLRCRFIPQKWISSVMRELIGAPVVDIRKIHSRRKAANYLAKYIGKQPQRFEGTKRYWRSQNWFDPWYEKLQDSEDEKPVFSVFKGGRLDWLAMQGALGNLPFGDAETAYAKPVARPPPPSPPGLTGSLRA